MTSTDAALNLGDPDPEAESAYVDSGDTPPRSTTSTPPRSTDPAA